MTRGTRAALVALLPLGALLAGCGGDDEPSTDSPTDKVQYVSMGDSYTAAPGVGLSSDATGCFRSEENYPHLIAEARDFILYDVSCGSAQTQHGENVQTTQERKTVNPQFDALGDEIDVVTVSLGANDGGLVPAIIYQCPVFLAADPANPSKTPCADIDADLPDGGSVDLIKTAPKRLVKLYRGIQDRAPNALVIAVGYPQIFPEEDGCELLPLRPGDVPWAAGIVRGLNQAIEKAAQRVGIPYVDLQTPSRDHHMCADEPWIAAAKTIPKRGAAYHPFPEEQALAAELVGQVIDEHLGTSPRDGD